ncbi:RNA polymerase sigma-70 factor [Actinomadura rupiterrae]|uniref:RNA polymerase sigma-70 factor n=1 Tax=Actinomadura rupiterrae TaxID=559627 RepID=UPI0020A3FF4C|nr:RNA polymerase sigma-70 factor [Actinomadura rupiterrae]MCP2336506.1 RNA polymerase sigma-70 factor (ECF subfamily) [Actinomadura rupiterrae]
MSLPTRPEPSSEGEALTVAGRFEAHRDRLFGVAYRMLGTVADAEDVVQDAWLRWSAHDREAVQDDEGYLVRIATNLALDRLRSVRVQREAYVGPWLPEPVITTPDVAAHAEVAESVSMALLVVLETLSPLERAVFVLREAFGFPYTEIAAALGRSEASVRQVGTRARKHVDARRPRFDARPDARRAAVDRFLDAAVGGDINELMAVLAPDIALWTDGGGKVRAALRVIHGAEKVVRFFLGIIGRPYQGVPPDEWRLSWADINGAPGLVLEGPDRVLATIGVVLDDQDRIATAYMVSNPDKLHAVQGGRTLTD